MCIRDRYGTIPPKALVEMLIWKKLPVPPATGGVSVPVPVEVRSQPELRISVRTAMLDSRPITSFLINIPLCTPSLGLAVGFFLGLSVGFFEAAGEKITGWFLYPLPRGL